MSYRIDIFYLLDSSSKLTQIITYFQTHEHLKLINPFFTGYFPSPSVCHKNFRFYWKLLRIYSHKLEKLIITFFTYFQTHENLKLMTPFFTGYFPSPSICHKNFRFYWKLLRIYSYKLEKLIITFFGKKMKKCEFVTTDISIYTDISYTYITI